MHNTIKIGRGNEKEPILEKSKLGGTNNAIRFLNIYLREIL